MIWETDTTIDILHTARKGHSLLIPSAFPLGYVLIGNTAIHSSAGASCPVFLFFTMFITTSIFSALEKKNEEYETIPRNV